MSLKEEIIKIVQLQEIDLRVYNFKQEKDLKIPQDLELIKTESEEIKQAIVDLEKKLKTIQLNKKEKEVDLASKEEILQKHQTQLYQLKTNKEYQAKLTEIASVKADISIVEETLLKVLDEIDSVKNDFEVQKKTIEEKGKELKQKEEKLQNEIKDIDAQIGNLEAKRKGFCDQVDNKIFAKYEQLLQSRNGMALVKVNNGNCGACHMSLNHQKINELKMFKSLIFCDNCVRILYIPEDLC